MHQQIINFLSFVVFALSATLFILKMKKSSSSSEHFRYDPYASTAYYRDDNTNPEYVSEYSDLQGTGGAYANTYVPFGQNNSL